MENSLLDFFVVGGAGRGSRYEGFWIFFGRYSFGLFVDWWGS